MRIGEIWKYKDLIADGQRGYYYLKEFKGNDIWAVVVSFKKEDSNSCEMTIPIVTETTGEHIFKHCIREK
jgi:hypothetical protein